MRPSIVATWPTRRLAAWAILTPAVFAALVGASGVRVADVSIGWLALSLVSAVLGAAVLASYLPAHGWRPEVGCSPCATVAGLTLVGATMLVHSYSSGVTGPLLASAVTLFGLAQRLGDTGACATRATPHDV